MSLTTDPNDPRLNRGGPQHEAYLVLSDEEIAKGFVRPMRFAYRHVGLTPRFPLRDLTPEEVIEFAAFKYAKFEAYPESEGPLVGKYWTERELKPCNWDTRMGLRLCETYARDPKFYGATFCAGCQKHYPVGEFRWIEHDGKLGPAVGS